MVSGVISIVWMFVSKCSKLRLDPNLNSTERYLGSMRGRSFGFLEASLIVPRLLGRSSVGIIMTPSYFSKSFSFPILKRPVYLKSSVYTILVD